MSDVRPDPKLIIAIEKLTRAFMGKLAEAEAAGKLNVDGRLGVIVSSLMRAVDRIRALPDDRDLTSSEADWLKASALQVAVAGIALVDELPSQGLAVVIAGFDVGNPQ